MSRTRTLLRMRAVVERDLAVGEDDWGQKPAPNWTLLHDALPCRVYYETRGREGQRILDGAKTAVIEDPYAIVPARADVAEGDRIVAVNDRRGQRLIDGVLKVQSVLRRADHLALVLESVG